MSVWKYIGLILAIIFIPIVGYGIMHGAIYVLPIEGNVGAQLFYTALIIAVGLAIPYFMLKLSAHNAHLGDPSEEEFELRNFSREQEELHESS